MSRPKPKKMSGTTASSPKVARAKRLKIINGVGLVVIILISVALLYGVLFKGVRRPGRQPRTPVPTSTTGQAAEGSARAA